MKVDEIARLPFVLGGFSQGAMLAVETALCGLAKRLMGWSFSLEP